MTRPSGPPELSKPLTVCPLVWKRRSTEFGVLTAFDGCRPADYCTVLYHVLHLDTRLTRRFHGEAAEAALTQLRTKLLDLSLPACLDGANRIPPYDYDLMIGGGKAVRTKMNIADAVRFAWKFHVSFKPHHRIWRI